MKVHESRRHISYLTLPFLPISIRLGLSSGFEFTECPALHTYGSKDIIWLVNQREGSVELSNLQNPS